VQRIETTSAPKPAGHYSQGIAHGGFVFVAGQLPIDPAGSGPPHTVGSIEEQTERTLANVRAILEAAGSSLDRVVQMTVYISDMSLWPRVNTTYARVMGESRPARAIVPVKELHHGFQIEIQAVAATG
jgi:2-iminobutanoate/2-iminopropanoate deaminase